MFTSPAFSKRLAQADEDEEKSTVTAPYGPSLDTNPMPENPCIFLACLEALKQMNVDVRRNKVPFVRGIAKRQHQEREDRIGGG